MRVMTFSEFFPSYHPKAAQHTHFVEKIWKSFMCKRFGLPKEWHGPVNNYTKLLNSRSPIDLMATYTSIEPKFHTMRQGHRWKPGDKFSPRIWTKKAYRSPQLVIGPDIEVKKTWDVKIKVDDNFFINGQDCGAFISFNGIVEKLAKNDGLSTEDLLDWFPSKKEFDGQIICWNTNIEY